MLCSRGVGVGVWEWQGSAGSAGAARDQNAGSPREHVTVSSLHTWHAVPANAAAGGAVGAAVRDRDEWNGADE